MDRLITITSCEDGSCCCLPQRSSIALISIMSLMASLIDMYTSSDSCSGLCLINQYVNSMRTVLFGMFQIVNLLLLAACIIENAFLVNVYVCYTLGFVVMGLCVSILELMYRVKQEGVVGIVYFVPEVTFMFVLSRCLPMVNAYGNYLDDISRFSTK